ncbi:hypothetical protein [Kistimonas scapharcae]
MTTVNAELVVLPPGGSLSLNELYNGQIQTTTVYCDTDYHHERTSFSIRQESSSYQVLMNNDIAETCYFFSSALNTVKKLKAHMNEWDIEPARCGIKQEGNHYLIMIDRNAAETVYFFDAATKTLQELRDAGICR